jgi:hypothetical protein
MGAQHACSGALRPFNRRYVHRHERRRASRSTWIVCLSGVFSALIFSHDFQPPFSHTVSQGLILASVYLVVAQAGWLGEKEPVGPSSMLRVRALGGAVPQRSLVATLLQRGVSKGLGLS